MTDQPARDGHQLSHAADGSPASMHQADHDGQHDMHQTMTPAAPARVLRLFAEWTKPGGVLSSSNEAVKKGSSYVADLLLAVTPTAKVWNDAALHVRIPHSDREQREALCAGMGISKNRLYDALKALTANGVLVPLKTGNDGYLLYVSREAQQKDRAAPQTLHDQPPDDDAPFPTPGTEPHRERPPFPTPGTARSAAYIERARPGAPVDLNTQSSVEIESQAAALPSSTSTLDEQERARETRRLKALSTWLATTMELFGMAPGSDDHQRDSDRESAEGLFDQHIFPDDAALGECEARFAEALKLAQKARKKQHLRDAGKRNEQLAAKVDPHFNAMAWLTRCVQNMARDREGLAPIAPWRAKEKPPADARERSPPADVGHDAPP